MRIIISSSVLTIISLLLIIACSPIHEALVSPETDVHETREALNANYWVYVGAESEDLIHRIRLGPDGAEVERTTPVGEIFNKIEGPHGLSISPDGEYLYMSTGHGFPDGKLWKIRLGEEADEVIEDPIGLGKFPATVDVTPDGRYAFIVNFNLHGEMVPSTVSVVDLSEFEEVRQTEVGVMPHGSRISPDGEYHYSGMMMDDHLIELSTETFQVNRRFNVAVGEEGPIDKEHYDVHEDHEGMERSAPHMSHDPSCSPTWAQPSATGEHIYVACNAEGHVLEISFDTWEHTRTFETGQGPYNIDVSPDNSILVVTLKQGDGVEFIDRESGETLARLESSTTVTHGAVVSPDSRYAFISVEGVGGEPGKVDIYDLESFELIDSVETGKQASGIDFWKMEPVN